MSRRSARTRANGRRRTIRGGVVCLGPTAGVAGWGRRRSGSLRSPPRRRPHPELFLTFHQGDISICEKEGTFLPVDNSFCHGGPKETQSGVLEAGGRICHPERSEGSRWWAGTCTMSRRFFATLRMTLPWTWQSSCTTGGGERPAKRGTCLAGGRNSLVSRETLPSPVKLRRQRKISAYFRDPSLRSG